MEPIALQKSFCSIELFGAFEAPPVIAVSSESDHSCEMDRPNYLST